MRFVPVLGRGVCERHLTHAVCVRVCLWAVYLQEEKDELSRQLQETMEVEEANRRKIIVKFKARYV